MPSPNPPADAADADASPAIVLRDGGAEARIGRLRENPAGSWRYAVLDTGDGRQFRGYLWQQEP